MLYFDYNTLSYNTLVIKHVWYAEHCSIVISVQRSRNQFHRLISIGTNIPYLWIKQCIIDTDFNIKIDFNIDHISILYHIVVMACVAPDVDNLTALGVQLYIGYGKSLISGRPYSCLPRCIYVERISDHICNSLSLSKK